MGRRFQEDATESLAQIFADSVGETSAAAEGLRRDLERSVLPETRWLLCVAACLVAARMSLALALQAWVYRKKRVRNNCKKL